MALRRLSTPAALVAAIALAAPGAAVADHGPAFSDPALTRYLEVAAAHWGGTPPTCTASDGQPIAAHAVLYDAADPRVSAMAEQPGCRIWLDRDHWPRPLDKIDCTIITHEWGHLVGRPHSDDRDSVMYGEPTSGAPGCALLAAAARPTASSPSRRATREARSHLKHARKRSRSDRAKRARRARSCRNLRARKRVALRRASRQGTARRAAARREVVRKFRLRKARCRGKRAGRKQTRS